MRLLGSDPDGPGSRHPADPAVRLRGPEAALPAEVRERRVEPRLRPLRARGGLGSRLDADQRPPRRRRVGDQRDQELDHQRRDRRLLRGHGIDRPREPTHHRLRRRRGCARVLDRRPGEEDGDQGLADRIAGARGRARARRERRRRGRQGPRGRPRRPAADPARRRRPGGRPRPGRDRLRQRLRQGAGHLRQADPRAPGDRLQAGRDGGPHGCAPASCSTGPPPQPTAASPTSRSGPRWRS